MTSMPSKFYCTPDSSGTLMPFVKEAVGLSLFHDPSVRMRGESSLSLSELSRACSNFRRVATGRAVHHAYAVKASRARSYEVLHNIVPERGHRFSVRRLSPIRAQESCHEAFFDMGPVLARHPDAIELGYLLNQPLGGGESDFCEQLMRLQSDGRYWLSGFYLALRGETANEVVGPLQPFQGFFENHISRGLGSIVCHTVLKDVQNYGESQVFFEARPVDDSFRYSARVILGLVEREMYVTAFEMGLKVFREGIDGDALIAPYRSVMSRLRRDYLTQVDRALLS